MHVSDPNLDPFNPPAAAPAPAPPPQEDVVGYASEHIANVMAAVRELQHPKRVGPYHILELSGEGGMGLVYKAEQRAPSHRIVALKLIKVGIDTREVIGRFESERQALALMNHT